MKEILDDIISKKYSEEKLSPQFKSTKTGRSYSSHEDMLAAEAEYDRQEGERMKVKDTEKTREREWFDRKRDKQ